MVSFGEKAKIKKAGNLNQGCSYVITIVLDTQGLELEGWGQILIKMEANFQTQGLELLLDK